MKSLLTLIFICSTTTLSGQYNITYQLGAGTSILIDQVNNVNYWGSTFDATLTYHSTKNIAISINSITGIGKNLRTENNLTFYQQEAFLIYYRLFRRNIFLGTGVSLAHTWEKAINRFSTTGKPIEYRLDNRFLLGWSLNINFLIWSNTNYNMYLKVYQQSPFGGNISGISLLLGNQF